MQNRDHQGEGQQGGQQGANTSGNKNQLDGNQGNPGNQTSSQNKSQGQASSDSTQSQFSSNSNKSDSNSNRSGSNSGSNNSGSSNSGSNGSRDKHLSNLSQKFGQKHGLNQQQSDDAADSWLGSVNWASKQKKDDEFNDFVNPQTQSSKNSLYNGWQSEYNNRLRKNGFEENQANKLSSEEPDSYFKDLSGADENWYSEIGNDGRDVSNDGSSSRNDGSSNRDGSSSRSDRSSTTSDENSDSSDAEGQTSRRRRTEEEEMSTR